MNNKLNLMTIFHWLDFIGIFRIMTNRYFSSTKIR